MRYYYEFINLYLPKLIFKYKLGDDKNKEKIINEIYNNKKLREFQKEYIIKVLKGEKEMSYIPIKYNNRK